MTQITSEKKSLPYNVTQSTGLIMHRFWQTLLTRTIHRYALHLLAGDLCKCDILVGERVSKEYFLSWSVYWLMLKPFGHKILCIKIYMKEIIIHCYRCNVCPPTNPYIEPLSSCHVMVLGVGALEVIGIRWSPESRSLMNGISALIMSHEKAFSPLCSHKYRIN